MNTVTPSTRRRRPCGMNPALAARVRQLEDERDHRLAVAEFRARHVADQQRRTDALISEAVAALAELLSSPKSATCPDCRHALAPRVRNCPHCRQAGEGLASAA